MQQAPIKILIPSDLTSRAQVALKYAYTLSGIFPVQIDVIHIFEETAGHVIFYNPSQEAMILKNVRDKLIQLAGLEGFSTEDNISFSVVVGRIHEKIIEQSLQNGYHLIIMSVNSSHDPQNRIIGSNALKVIRTSPVPVIIADFSAGLAKLNRVLVPVDLSKDFNEKVKRIIELNKLNENMIFCFVSVMFDVDEYTVNKLVQQMVKIKAVLDKLKIKYTAELVRANSSFESIAEIIKDYSRKADSDVIMLMPHQEARQTPYFVSTLAQEIINITDIPVITAAPSPF